MTDQIEPGDVSSDESYRADWSDTRACWVLTDMDVETVTFPSLPEMKAFVRGVWVGLQAMGHDTDLVCSFRKGNILVDTLVSKDYPNPFIKSVD